MIVREATGFWLWVLNRLGCDGLTMPWRRIYIRPECMFDAGLIQHEFVHIEQIDRLGPVRFSVTYLWQLWFYGYRRMPLEREANEVQREVYALLASVPKDDVS